MGVVWCGVKGMVVVTKDKDWLGRGRPWCSKKEP